MDGLTQIVNSPRADGLSPCQVLFVRSIRTMIPTLTEALGTNECVEEARKRKKYLDDKQRHLYDRRSKDLKPLEEGVRVFVQNQDTKKCDDQATILSRVRKRTYKIQIKNGKITYRNRRWIRKIKIIPDVDNCSEEYEETQKDVPKFRRSKRIKDKNIKIN